MPASYRVGSPFIAIKPLEDRSCKIITIPSNSMIEIRGQVLQSGLVDIWFEGQVVAAFMRDIEERCTILPG